MPYEFICPHCGGKSYSAAANSNHPCPHCGKPLDAATSAAAADVESPPRDER